MVPSDGCFSARLRTWCPLFCRIFRGNHCGKACGSSVLRRKGNTVPFYMSSRTNVRDLPGCCSLSLARGFLVAKAPTSPRWGSCAASSKCSCKQAFLLASGGMTASTAPYNHAARNAVLLRRKIEFNNPPASLRSAPSLTQGGQGWGLKFRRKESRTFPQRDPICAYLRLCGKRSRWEL